MRRADRLASTAVAHKPENRSVYGLIVRLLGLNVRPERLVPTATRP